MIIALAVLAAALLICTASMLFLNGTVDEAERLDSLAVLAANGGRSDRAAELMVQLAEFWRQRAPVMEMLASHDALHEVDSAIAEAQICLECRDHDDFLRTMSVVTAALQHIRDEEAVSWSNLY